MRKDNSPGKKLSSETDEGPNHEGCKSGSDISSSTTTNSPPVINDWCPIFDSKALVKTKEGRSCGNVVDEYNDNIVLIDFSESTSQEYLVPKSTVEGYDGKFLYLNIQHENLMRYGY